MAKDTGNPNANEPNAANAAAGASPPANPNLVKPIEKLNIEKFAKNEFKEFKIEKNEAKENKDQKNEKIEKNEIKEHKDAKLEKLEKNEIKEHKDGKQEKLEKVEHKELLKNENVEKQFKELEGKDLVETQVNPGDSVEQRLANLEQTVNNLNHFIQAGQRPDLAQGALNREPDNKPGGGNR